MKTKLRSRSVFTYKEINQEETSELGNEVGQSYLNYDIEPISEENTVGHSYLNYTDTETITEENTVKIETNCQHTLAYDTNDAITEVLQVDSLRFDEKLSSGQILKADKEETNVTSHTTNFQITRKDDSDFHFNSVCKQYPPGEWGRFGRHV